MAGAVLQALLAAYVGVRTAFSQAINANSGGNNSSSFRIVITPTQSGSQIRITIRSGTAGPTTLDHVSVGTQTTTYNTSATPTEVKFGGVSGMTQAASLVDKASDFTPFNVVTGVPIVVIFDVNAGAANLGRLAVVAVSYFSAGASWNTASPAGSWTLSTTDSYAVSKIEVL